MAVPTYDQFIEPVLRYLALHPDGVPARQVYEASADAPNLSRDGFAVNHQWSKGLRFETL